MSMLAIPKLFVQPVGQFAPPLQEPGVTIVLYDMVVFEMAAVSCASTCIGCDPATVLEPTNKTVG